MHPLESHAMPALVSESSGPRPSISHSKPAPAVRPPVIHRMSVVIPKRRPLETTLSKSPVQLLGVRQSSSTRDFRL